MIRVGVAGLGFMGTTHLKVHSALEGVRVVALFDSDPRRAGGDFRGVFGNVATGGEIRLGKVRSYADLDAFLADPGVDVVDICLPTHLHAPVAIRALGAGRHVLCEKPMALTLTEGRRVAAAASRAKGFYMVAHCLRFWPAYLHLRDLIRSRPHGPLKALSLFRAAARPTWSAVWIGRKDQCGGAFLDMHIHDVDVLTWLFGLPRSVCARGTGADVRRMGYDHVAAQYDFPGVDLVVAEGGWLAPPSFPFRARFDAVFERAWLEFNTLLDPPLRLHREGGDPVVPALSARDGYHEEIAYFMDCIRRRRAPEEATAERVLDTLRVLEAEEASMRSGRPVRIAAPPVAPRRRARRRRS